MARDLTELVQLHSELNRMFEVLRRSVYSRSTGDAAALAPKFDIRQSETEWVLEMDLPGVALEDVQVETQGQMLLVSGEVRRRAKGRAGRVLQLERGCGRFMRLVPVTVAANTREGEAELTAGVLTVRFRRVSERRGAKLPVKLHG